MDSNKFEYNESDNEQQKKFKSFIKKYIIIGLILTVIIIGIVIYNMRQLFFADLISFIISSFFTIELVSGGITVVSKLIMELNSEKVPIFNKIYEISRKIATGVFALGFIVFGVFAIYKTTNETTDTESLIFFIIMGSLFIIAGIYLLITQVFERLYHEILKRLFHKE